jgi:hypothetical protein
VKLLRSTLRWQAVLWALAGAVLLVAPGWLVEVLLDQPSLGEDAWLRLAGILSIALAAQMVLVGHRLEDHWWWCWTFVFVEVATAVVFLLNALLGLPEGSPSWPWWGLGTLNAAFAAVEIAALAKTGTERSPV